MHTNKHTHTYIPYLDYQEQLSFSTFYGVNLNSKHTHTYHT